MSNIETGGPAFPVFPETSGGHGAAFPGMMLRDYFAAKAMQSVLRNFGQMPDDDSAGDFIDAVFSAAPGFAYAMADAMMEARK